jgi:hypothetical protein
MKKILFLAFIFSMNANLVSASSNAASYYDTIFAPVITDTEFALSAKTVENTVVLQWAPVSKAKPEGFMYYKIVRSEKNATPVYPEDGYIEYLPDIASTYFTDKHQFSGKSFYRICAIYDADATGLKPRICSNVASVMREGGQNLPPPENTNQELPKIEEKKQQLPPVKPVVEPPKRQEETKRMPEQNSGVSASVKKRLDTILSNFQKNLDKRDISSTEKIAIIEKAVNRYSELATKSKLPATKKMSAYMVEKLNAMKSQYMEDDISEIESILSGL